MRHSVLWPGAPISQVCLPDDQQGWHFGAFITSQPEPVAVISLFAEPLPIDNTADDVDSIVDSSPSKPVAIRFRKFACDVNWQGRGIGTKLLDYSLSVARSELRGTVLWCDARTSSARWYQKRGLTPFGEKFLKSSVEYVRMKIEI